MKQQNQPPRAEPEPPSWEDGTPVPGAAGVRGPSPSSASGSSEASGKDLPAPGSVFPVTLHGGAVKPSGSGPAAIQNLLGVSAVLTAGRLWGKGGGGGDQGVTRGCGSGAGEGGVGPEDLSRRRGPHPEARGGSRWPAASAGEASANTASRDGDPRGRREDAWVRGPCRRRPGCLGLGPARTPLTTEVRSCTVFGSVSAISPVPSLAVISQTLTDTSVYPRRRP